VGTSTTPTGVVCEGNGLDIEVSFSDASGTTTERVFAKDRALRGAPEDVILTTGPSGMARHPGASIVVNRGFPTTQGGLGAVFGQMGLDHLILRGTGGIPRQSALEKQVTDAYEAAIPGNPLTASERNYPGFAMWVGDDLVGYAASPAFSGALTDGAKQFDGSSMMAFAADDGGQACPGCPQWCLKSFTTGPHTPIDGGRAHQLGISGAALMLDITDPATLVEFNQTCHDLGVEHLGAIDSLRGQPVNSGELDTQILSAIDSHPLGPDPSFRVKGMVIPPFDPRGNQGLGVGFALNPTGPRYDVLEHDIDFDAGQPWMGRENLGRDFGIPSGGLEMGTLTPNRHESLVKLWLAWSGMDAVGLCEFAAPPTRELTIEAMCELATEISGENITREAFYELGRFRLALLRDINHLLGVTPADDTLPEHFFAQPVVDGRLAGAVVSKEAFEAASDHLRDHLGWSPAGGIAGDADRHAMMEVSELLWVDVKGALR
jgi:aldehyde:ferredoxin oxidoreductase